MSQKTETDKIIHSENSSPSPKQISSKRFQCTLTTFIVLSVIFVLFLFILLVSIIYYTHVMDPSNSNVNHIIVPEGKKLNDLNIFTFHEYQMVSFYEGNIVLDEDEEFQTISAYGSEFDDGEVLFEDENDFLIITAVPHRERKYQARCTGTCNCFIDDGDGEEDRKIANLVFSHRYTAVVAVSILGFASAKFIGEKLHHCYETARELLGYNRMGILVCGLDDDDCIDLNDADFEFVQPDYTDKKKLKGRQYQCIGRCVTNKKLPSKDPRFLQNLELINCEAQSGGEVNLYAHDVRHAEQIYHDTFLKEFCKGWFLHMKWEDFDDLVNPCASKEDEILNNIICVLPDGVNEGE